MFNFKVKTTEENSDITLFINKHSYKLNISDLYEFITDLNKAKFDFLRKKQNTEIDKSS